MTESAERFAGEKFCELIEQAARNVMAVTPENIEVIIVPDREMLALARIARAISDLRDTLHSDHEIRHIFSSEALQQVVDGNDRWRDFWQVRVGKS